MMLKKPEEMTMEEIREKKEIMNGKGDIVMNMEKANKLLEIGGKEWKKKGHRIYLNMPVFERFGLHIERYNTGNISYAELDGEKMSNSAARKVLAQLDGAYYDVERDEIKTSFGREETAKDIVRKIREYIEE